MGQHYLTGLYNSLLVLLNMETALNCGNYHHFYWQQMEIFTTVLQWQGIAQTEFQPRGKFSSAIEKLTISVAYWRLRLLCLYVQLCQIMGVIWRHLIVCNGHIFHPPTRGVFLCPGATRWVKCCWVVRIYTIACSDHSKCPSKWAIILLTSIHFCLFYSLPSVLITSVIPPIYVTINSHLLFILSKIPMTFIKPRTKCPEARPEVRFLRSRSRGFSLVFSMATIVSQCFSELQKWAELSALGKLDFLFIQKSRTRLFVPWRWNLLANAEKNWGKTTTFAEEKLGNQVCCFSQDICLIQCR